MTHASADEMSQAQLLHGRELLRRLHLTVPQAVAHMENEGLARRRGPFMELAVA